MPEYSVIVPVYNRRDEVADLLESLSKQTFRDFEVILVEDGSTDPCEDIALEYHDRLDVKYFYKVNDGHKSLGDKPLDCFGGPDAAHASFTPTQKAISFAMTSFLTTGGIRGGKTSMEKFVPRSFNMGYSREVYDTVGGFCEMFSEDIDMSTRIRQAGFSIGLIRDAYVYHKRRVDFKKFWRQVHVFGMSRITAVHTLPALAVIIGLVLVAMGIFVSPWWLLPIGIYIVALFAAALAATRSLRIALLAVPASIVQITGYGTGFIRAWFSKILLRRGRDINQEIAMRKGK